MTSYLPGMEKMPWAKQDKFKNCAQWPLHHQKGSQFSIIYCASLRYSLNSLTTNWAFVLYCAVKSIFWGEPLARDGFLDLSLVLCPPKLLFSCPQDILLNSQPSDQLLRLCPNIDWSWIGNVSDGWCWSVLVGLWTDFGFSFDAALTIDTGLYFRESNGDRQSRWRRLESTSSSRTS